MVVYASGLDKSEDSALKTLLAINILKISFKICTWIEPSTAYLSFTMLYGNIYKLQKDVSWSLFKTNQSESKHWRKNLIRLLIKNKLKNNSLHELYSS